MMSLMELNQTTIPFQGHLIEYANDMEEINATINSNYSTILDDALPLKEKDPGVSLYLAIMIIFLDELAPTKLIVELANRTVKRPKGIAENVLVGINKFVFPVDFIVLDIPEDINVPLILERPFLSTAHAIIDVFKRKIALRVGNDKIVFKSNNPTNRSQDLEFRDFLELNEPLELRRNQEINNLGPKIKEGEVINEPMIDISKTRHDDEIIEGIHEYPNFCNYDRKWFYNSILKDKIKFRGKNVVGALMNVPILVGNFWLRVLKQDGSMDLLPFTIVSSWDKLDGISHPYQKLKGFYKGALNLGPEYIRDAKTVEWLTRRHVSVHEME
ncbi:lysophospholipid acyltransferase 1-like protein [Tanacetum coccineum]